MVRISLRHCWSTSNGTKGRCRSECLWKHSYYKGYSNIYYQVPACAIHKYTIFFLRYYFWKRKAHAAAVSNKLSFLLLPIFHKTHNSLAAHIPQIAYTRTSILFPLITFPVCISLPLRNYEGTLIFQSSHISQFLPSIRGHQESAASVARISIGSNSL